MVVGAISCIINWIYPGLGSHGDCEDWDWAVYI